jgi:hypothetical protein
MLFENWRHLVMGLMSMTGDLKLMGICRCHFLLELFPGNLSLWRPGLTDLKMALYSNNSWQLPSSKDHHQLLERSHLVFEWIWPEQVLTIDLAVVHYCLQTMLAQRKRLAALGCSVISERC